MGEPTDPTGLPSVPDHPVLRLMDASTTATVENNSRLQALEKSVDSMSARVEGVERSFSGASTELRRLHEAWASRTEEIRVSNELKRRKILMDEEGLRLQREMYGQRWARYSQLVKDIASGGLRFAKQPWVTIPLGAIGYGLAKLIATFFGFDVGVLP